MIKLNFYLKSDKLRADLGCPIFLKLTCSGKSTTLSTNKWITKERWNATNKLKNPLRIDKEIITNNPKSVMCQLYTIYNFFMIFTFTM